MLIYREILPNESVAKECARMIQEYSWGTDYPVNAWSELKESDHIIGCFDDEKLVGLGSVTCIASPDKVDNGLPWLADAVVLPEYRRRGIYKSLYNMRIEHFKKNNAQIILTCTDNPVIENFLLQNGWLLRRTTKDESGGDCKVFQINPQT